MQRLLYRVPWRADATRDRLEIAQRVWRRPWRLRTLCWRHVLPGAIERKERIRRAGNLMRCSACPSEWSIIALILALAAVGRLLLAAQGWPGVDSDESIVGLMTDDILRHGAHPVFFYGQNYMGALQAYLAVPFFLLLGATPFALLVTATAETSLCFLILYLFTRAGFSRAVALVTLLLLAAGPFSALRAELHVGAGEHDSLLLGALLLWLVALRLRGRGGVRTRLALDAGSGLIMGLALWSDFLILPFALAALLALMLCTAWRLIGRRERALRLCLGAEAGIAAVFFLIGLAPLLIANIGSGGATFREVFGAANAQNAQFTPPLPPD
jgi:hypothetical protein